MRKGPIDLGGRRLLLLVFAFLALAVGVAACGGDDSAAPSEPPAADPPAPAADPEPPPPADDPPPPADDPPPPADVPPPPAEPAGCPFESGEVAAFGTVDRAGNAGDIGPSMVRTFEPWVENLNAAGGILGCTFVIDIPDEPFPDVDACLRNFRNAINEGDKYTFFFGAFNSACQAAVPDLTNAAGKIVIANSAADHIPHFEKFAPLNVHAAVSTFLEGRSMAVFATEQGWKRIATLSPNYAYGQDAMRAFRDYFLELNPDGEIVNEQFPEFDEDNYAPFINAMAAAEPDAVVSTFFGPFIVPFWKQWKAAGLEDIPTIGGLVDTPTFEVVTTVDDLPANSYGYDRGYWELLSTTPVGKQVADTYIGDSDHPLPSAWTFPWISGIQMAQALAEATGGFDPQAWIDIIETGTFTFDSPYHSEPTKVNPINHMANTCATVGQVVPSGADNPLPVTFTLEGMRTVCMDELIPTAEAAAALTDNPNVSQEAIDAYYSTPQGGTPGG
jgi:branched-chain amino acid transport system substrate-binding protein